MSNAARTQQPRENDITELRPFRVEISGAAIDDEAGDVAEMGDHSDGAAEEEEEEESTEHEQTT